MALSDENIIVAANEAFNTTTDLDDQTLVNKYGHGVYISRFLDFARAIEAEVRKQVEPLIRQTLEALEGVHQGEHHGGVDEAITAARAWLEGKG